MMSVGNAAGSYYMTCNLQATSDQLAIFMGLDSVPAFIFMPLVPAIKKKVGKRGMFNIFLSIAIVGMALGGVVPGLVLSYVGFNARETVQTAFAEQGILWLVCAIPALLLGLAMYIISRYELTDEVIDRINIEIEKRNK